MDHQYGEAPAGDHGRGNVAVEVPHEAAMAVGAQDYEADLVLLGGVDDPLPSRGGLDGRSLRPEAGLGVRATLRARRSPPPPFVPRWPGRRRNGAR